MFLDKDKDKDKDQDKVLARAFDTVREELLKAAGDPGHPFRLMTVATPDIAGPGLRQVVLRHATEAMHLYFYTDVRTAKVKQIKQQPVATVLFFDPENKAQLVIKAEARLHYRDKLARDHWSRVDYPSKKVYGTLQQPGTIIENPGNGYDYPDVIDDSNFCVVELITQSLDLYEIHDPEGLRARFERADDGWESYWIVP